MAKTFSLKSFNGERSAQDFARNPANGVSDIVGFGVDGSGQYVLAFYSVGTGNGPDAIIIDDRGVIPAPIGDSVFVEIPLLSSIGAPARSILIWPSSTSGAGYFFKLTSAGEPLETDGTVPERLPLPGALKSIWLKAAAGGTLSGTILCER